LLALLCLRARAITIAGNGLACRIGGGGGGGSGRRSA
jgi:hypothetical protein